ncbi:hypothetical protein F4780DRAFT_410160 [Xylariomycetidae sp. FL0641]|nr:hypothetical protein F4780DRAFT_410160 [Xylariomycetidae sp. FL0641]
MRVTYVRARAYAQINLMRRSGTNGCNREEMLETQEREFGGGGLRGGQRGVGSAGDGERLARLLLGGFSRGGYWLSGVKARQGQLSKYCTYLATLGASARVSREERSCPGRTGPGLYILAIRVSAASSDDRPAVLTRCRRVVVGYTLYSGIIELAVVVRGPDYLENHRRGDCPNRSM